MRRARLGLLLLLLSLSPGCLGTPKLAFEDVFAQSDAHHDGDRYAVNLRGRVVNLGPDGVAWVRVFAAIGADCLKDPAEWPGFVDLGDLAGGTSAQVRASFEQPGVPFTTPALWWRMTHSDTSRPVAKDCGALPVG